MEENAKYGGQADAAQGSVGENVRYLLWSQKLERSRWRRTVANWAGCGPERARALLRDEQPTPGEVASLSVATGVAEPDLAYGRLVQGQDILLENLRHVFRDAERGAKSQLALRIGVDRTTISNWLNGRQRPHRAHLDRLAREFGLLEGAQFETEPLFLSFDPVAVQQRRAWLRERIDALDDRTIAELFPALKRLLEGP